MKPLRKYDKAFIRFKDGDGEEAFEVCVYQNLVIYFNSGGDELTIPMYYIQDVANRIIDRVSQTRVVS